MQFTVKVEGKTLPNTFLQWKAVGSVERTVRRIGFRRMENGEPRSGDHGIARSLQIKKTESSVERKLSKLSSVLVIAAHARTLLMKQQGLWKAGRPW